MVHRTCNGNPIESWTWIDGVHICNNNQQKSCLTVSSYSNWNYNVLSTSPGDCFLDLTDYNNPKTKSQYWKLDKSTGAITIFAKTLSMCLSNNSQTTLRFPNSVETSVILSYNIIGESNCISWDFIPNPGNQLCD